MFLASHPDPHHTHSRRVMQSFPNFDQAVGPGAYLWWYVDAISDDGQHALSIIAFVGSVFSPYYTRAFAKQGAAVDAQNHCAINVALYGPGSRRWAMTERGSASVARTASQFVIGPSQLKWIGDHLQIDLNEVSVPIPKGVLGMVRVYPEALCSYSNALDDQGKHRWGPIAPCARVEVDLQKPGVRWQGHGYLDSNEGDEPVTIPFKTWDWSRARMADGSTAVIYDVTQTNGAQTLLAERFKPDGTWESFTPAAQRERLPKTVWRIDRGIRADTASATKVLETLEDTPFYARSLLQTQLLGEQVTAVHETLEPQRLNNLPVRMMLPWRMPRRA
jgi:carotenoid 1,2-hydratase